MGVRVVKISVRNLVEFVLRSGNIDSRGGYRDADAMQKGSRIHRRIQRQMGPEYRAEVSLAVEMPVSCDGLDFCIIVEGRADGIIDTEEKVTIDEIKGIFMELEYLSEPFLVHKAQAMCYGYIYGKEKMLQQMVIQMTYCNLETEEIKRFQEEVSFDYLNQWFSELVQEYAKWAAWQLKWIETRNESIQGVEFPFPYRTGQRDLVVGVYKTILRKKKLYIEAPTGVGKTLSTVYPSVKAMGEGIAAKIFYLTAKTITRTVAEETFQILRDSGMRLKTVTLTAKEKICPLEKIQCNPDSCERAEGHFDRVNEAVFEMITREEEITREIISEYAQKHRVCPFEMALDVTLWADCIICDYNYAFAPNVQLKRFFQNEKKNDYIFLIDEAHNLVDRAREMYSAILFKDDFLAVKKIIKGKSKRLEKKLTVCNKDLVDLKKNWEERREEQGGTGYVILENINNFVVDLMNLVGECDLFLKNHLDFEEREFVLNFDFQLYYFLNIFELVTDKYVIYSNVEERDGKQRFFICLQCMNPADNLKGCLEKGISTVFFSATLLPIQYYKEQLAGLPEDYAIYAPSPFDVNKRSILIARDVSTKYTRRNQMEYERIVSYIFQSVRKRPGNYFVFFPSYAFLQSIYNLIEDDQMWQKAFWDMDIVIQGQSMSEEEKEAFLDGFQSGTRKIGFCVMGGIFSEGIDLKQNRLIGTVIVGTGLPMVCDERELFREYYDEKCGKGFEYAYLYNGMNKVLQSAGRVIRTTEDVGTILLLDERFMKQQYRELFPMEWYPYEIVTLNSVEGYLEKFWNKI
ncbi:ATP-dependent DNA helicase [Anaeromicropila populeti]|uniref:Rad3-related DNA helicase n=1 Tax=Anaeromicropila populeti TaxID=37658 RepID=A0A1I6HLI1_9FIRM|nr:ATP-dependent DNA helicase [Anaeromicropila populeti]SFR55140.1 Rad3-related DNA helicase [Anaeromicropila populeti]